MSDATPTWTSLVSAEALAAALGRSDVIVFDTRHSLAAPEAGEAAHRDAHIPGAFYAHLDRELSDHRKKHDGRHPWPELHDFTAALGRWGVTPQHQVVVYDAADGALAAARMWFLLRALGHQRVAVLDGGLQRWESLGLPLEADMPVATPAAAYPATFDESRLHLRGIEQPAFVEPRRIRRRGRGDGHVRFDRQPQRLPALQAAVEDGDALVPQRAQQEPHARGGERTFGRVVHHDLVLWRHAPAPERGSEVGKVGPRMATVVRLAVIGQLAIQVRIERTRDVRNPMRRFAGFRFGEAVARVEDDDVVATQRRGEVFGRHERGPVRSRSAHRIASRRWRRL